MHIDELRKMSDDEINNLNRTLGLKLMKRIAIEAAATVVVIAAAAIALKYLDKKTEYAD